VRKERPASPAALLTQKLQDLLSKNSKFALGAIVTDLGGLMSHAAIVSREFGIPCIVDTGNGSKILKDGDLVEVDANNGTVKIISKAKKEIFTKNYVRDNALVSFEIWNRNQTKFCGQVFSMDMESFILDATQGVTTVYYEESLWKNFEPRIISTMSDIEKFDAVLEEYGNALNYLEPIWKANTALPSREAFKEFVHQSVLGWTGMSIGYDIPNLNISEEKKAQGLKMRERGLEYFENMDHIVQATLRAFYPELGELVRYLSLEEVEQEKIPSLQVLEERRSHFIYFRDHIYTKISFAEWINKNNIEVLEDKPEATAYQELKGATAMKGIVQGRVKVVMKKTLLGEVKEGDVLVTSMTTPDFLPAMQKAVAYVTDEGGVTCHAAIVARELGKPCIIGTRFATQVLKDGDLVEVDADHGIVRIIKSN